MRCISNLDYLHLGIKVSGRTDTTRLQLRGHAQSEPHLCWRGKNTMFGSINGVLGGAIIFRCDVEVEDDLRLATLKSQYLIICFSKKRSKKKNSELK